MLNPTIRLRAGQDPSSPCEPAGFKGLGSTYTCELSKESRQPDAVDMKILHLLRHEGDLSVPRIAKGAAISESTAEYRIERLREWGAISEEMYFLRSDHDFVQAQLVLNLRANEGSVTTTTRFPTE
jgi:hypothetical protein